jgi:hypothetical protein
MYFRARQGAPHACLGPFLVPCAMAMRGAERAHDLHDTSRRPPPPRTTAPGALRPPARPHSGVEVFLPPTLPPYTQPPPPPPHHCRTTTRFTKWRPVRAGGWRREGLLHALCHGRAGCSACARTQQGGRAGGRRGGRAVGRGRRIHHVLWPCASSPPPSARCLTLCSHPPPCPSLLLPPHVCCAPRLQPATGAIVRRFWCFLWVFFSWCCPSPP